MVEEQDAETEVQVLEAIANLATTSVEDKQTIATLIATNASFVTEIIELRKDFAAFRKTSRNVNKCYCWTCGMHRDYDSRICKTKKSGHQDEETWKNKMGGNKNRHKPKS